MAKKAFSATERLAVYTAHGEKCYLCTKPIDLKTMQVDHIIPDSLEGTARLTEVIIQLGLPSSFNLQSYANWLPACGPCNNLKKDQVFEPVPIVLVLLKRAAEKASKAQAIAEKAVSEQNVQKALNTLERAMTIDALAGEEIKAQLTELFRFQTIYRTPEMVGKPILVSPGLELLADKDGIRIVRGPYGVGGGPSTNQFSPAMRCPGCGSPYFNGARCVLCGLMDDD
ncbi:restriction endonuclease [Janthinobacterium sp. HH01]|uniref:HNH endonuclease n=1 Tax=Janthinobacterium sp. HH01 TaxID=1198452 RepID=UPI0002AEC31E|nr:HNH endonuclease signature motif containing protein [Janthinobacterium sp. HH01]ELX10187.1 restriction endonuclease [Janthinobacterium sp. HH01]